VESKVVNNYLSQQYKQPTLTMRKTPVTTLTRHKQNYPYAKPANMNTCWHQPTSQKVQVMHMLLSRGSCIGVLTEASQTDKAALANSIMSRYSYLGIKCYSGLCGLFWAS
jgi:hypothetical protein